MKKVDIILKSHKYLPGARADFSQLIYNDGRTDRQRNICNRAPILVIDITFSLHRIQSVLRKETAQQTPQNYKITTKPPDVQFDDSVIMSQFNDYGKRHISIIFMLEYWRVQEPMTCVRIIAFCRDNDFILSYFFCFLSFLLFDECFCQVPFLLSQ